MGQVGRLAGAVLARSGQRWFLVGEPKVPLDLAAHGFREVGRLMHGGHEIVELAREGPVDGRPDRPAGRAGCPPEPEAREPAREAGAPPGDLQPEGAGERRHGSAGAAEGSARLPVPDGAPALPFTMPLEGEALARRLHDIFVITRNNSVSERLFRFLDTAQRGSPDLTWLALAPPEAIALIREGLLRCT